MLPCLTYEYVLTYHGGYQTRGRILARHSKGTQPTGGDKESLALARTGNCREEPRDEIGPDRMDADERPEGCLRLMKQVDGRRQKTQRDHHEEGGQNHHVRSRHHLVCVCHACFEALCFTH